MSIVGAALAEVQARQRMAELAHINRFSTAGELTASIAHEINQPLGSILTNAETAQSILSVSASRSSRNSKTLSMIFCEMTGAPAKSSGGFAAC